MIAPRVSVVIPTRNGTATLPALLESLRTQETDYPLDIVAVDSGSTDGTLDLLASRVTTLVRIEPESFDHGATRNVGVERATGQFVVLLVQDAVPASTDFLNRLAAPLVVDDTLAGTVARQQPRPNASALTRASLERHFAAQDKAWVSRLPGGLRELEALMPMERMRRCAFDNVASCIRRSIWIDHPFKPTPMAEDLEWARNVLLAGYGLAFVPDAVVTHSHDRPARYELDRTRVLHEQLFRLFGVDTIPDARALVRSIVSSLGFHLRCESQSPRRWLRASALALAWPAGQYLGARRGRAGGPSARLRPGLV